MHPITKIFLQATNIPETPNRTVEKIMDYLCEPESVNAMILMTELGQPALSGVVKKLEEQFGNSDFPLHHEGPHANSANRRDIGWMVRFVMREFGYTPCKDRQLRIGSFSKAKYFGSAAVYEKTITNPNYKVEMSVVENQD